MGEVESRPLPRRNPDTAPFWDACARHSLQFMRCTSCGKVRSLPTPGCSSCGSPEFTWVETNGNGTVSTFTVTHQPLHPGFATVPYTLAVVVLDVGSRIVSRIVDCPPDAVHIGMAVSLLWEDVPEAKTAIPLFRPVAEEAHTS